jgi:hypothetical protein
MRGFSMFKTVSRFRFAVVTMVLLPSFVLTACSPAGVLMPPGDMVVSSVRPMEPSSGVVGPSVAGPLVPVAIGDSSSAPEQVQEKKPNLVASLLSRTPLIGGNRAETVCQRQLRRLGVQFSTPAPVVGPGSCGIASPIKVKSLSGGIDVVPDATLNCPMALAFAKWVKNELASAARVRYLAGIKSIHQMSSYSCRTMNSKAGAPMSEHSKGNAIDIGKIKLNNGKSIVVKRPGLFSFREKSLLNNVRAESCKYFTTVLGPGSDVNHADHFHFDLRKRKTSYRHCDL